MKDPRLIAELCCPFGQQQTVGALCDFRGPADDLFRDTDLIHHHDVIHEISVDLPGDAGKGDQVVGHHDHLVGILAVGQCKTQQTAGCRTIHAI